MHINSKGLNSSIFEKSILLLYGHTFWHISHPNIFPFKNFISISLNSFFCVIYEEHILGLILLILILLFFFIIARVFYVQVFDYKKLSILANGLWSRELPIQADRGLILDRNGIVLADNVTTTSLVLIPNQIKDKEKTTKLLSEILNVEEKEMAKHVNKSTSIERVHPEGRSFSYEVANKISNLNLKGV